MGADKAAPPAARDYPPKRRPIRNDGYVWCDVHCAIHPSEPDYYQEGVEDCQRATWRPVYVLGERGETF